MPRSSARVFQWLDELRRTLGEEPKNVYVQNMDGPDTPVREHRLKYERPCCDERVTRQANMLASTYTGNAHEFIFPMTWPNSYCVSLLYITMRDSHTAVPVGRYGVSLLSDCDIMHDWSSLASYLQITCKNYVIYTEFGIVLQDTLYAMCSYSTQDAG